MDESRVEISATPGMFGSSLCGKREIDEDFIACGDFFGVRVAVLCDGMGEKPQAGRCPRNWRQEDL